MNETIKWDTYIQAIPNYIHVVDTQSMLNQTLRKCGQSKVEEEKLLHMQKSTLAVVIPETTFILGDTVSN